MQIDSYVSLCTKLKSKWIKNLNMKPDTLNLIEENVGNFLEDIVTGDKFLNRTPITQAQRSTIKKLVHVKLKSFCKAKYSINRTKW